jgi:hypothetical protein
MQWYAGARAKRDCHPTRSEVGIQFDLRIKRLFGLARLQALGLVESLLRLAGRDWTVPDCGTVCRRQKTLRVQLPYCPSTTAPDLLVNSTGMKFLGEGEWKGKKHVAEYRHQWSKVHLTNDVQTLDIVAVEAIDNGTGDGGQVRGGTCK